MVKKIIFSIACLYFLNAQADAPGKRSMSDSKITFKNTGKLSGYTFYWQLQNDSAEAFTNDSTFIIPGSGGVPTRATVWGIDKKTSESTDSIFLDNYYAPDFIITLDTISGNKLLYSKDQKANGNDGGYYSDNSGDKSADASPAVAMLLCFRLFHLLL